MSYNVNSSHINMGDTSDEESEISDSGAASSSFVENDPSSTGVGPGSKVASAVASKVKQVKGNKPTVHKESQTTETANKWKMPAIIMTVLCLIVSCALTLWVSTFAFIFHHWRNGNTTHPP